jgi:hypothetical protein
MWIFVVINGESLQNCLYYLSILWEQFLYWYSGLYILILCQCLCCYYSQTQIWYHPHFAPLNICEQKFCFCSILVYCHPKYNTTNFSEQIMALCWGLSVFVVPYSLWCRLTDLLSTRSIQHSTQQNRVYKSQATKFVTVMCNISSIITAVFFLAYENVYQFTHSK